MTKLQSVRMMSSVQQQFDSAKGKLDTLKEDPGCYWKSRWKNELPLHELPFELQISYSEQKVSYVFFQLSWKNCIQVSVNVISYIDTSSYNL